MNVLEHLPDCRPLTPCDNCRAISILKDKLQVSEIQSMEFLFADQFQHTKGCTPLSLCKNCDAAKLLRSRLSETEIEMLMAIFTDSRMTRKVDTLELSVRTSMCLRNQNIVTVGDLVKFTEAEILRTPNFGRKSLNELKEILASVGLRFGMS